MLPASPSPPDTVWFPNHPWQRDLGFRRFRLTRPYGYAWRHDGINHLWVLPMGWEHDGASVPRIVRSFIPPEPFDRAAPFHDRGYHFRGLLPLGEHMIYSAGRRQWVDALGGPFGSREPWTREALDRLFARMLREDPKGPGKLGRRSAYVGIRWFGGGHWNRTTGVAA